MADPIVNLTNLVGITNYSIFDDPAHQANEGFLQDPGGITGWYSLPLTYTFTIPTGTTYAVVTTTVRAFDIITGFGDLSNIFFNITDPGDTTLGPIFTGTPYPVTGPIDFGHRGALIPGEFTQRVGSAQPGVYNHDTSLDADIEFNIDPNSYSFTTLTFQFDVEILCYNAPPPAPLPPVSTSGWADPSCFTNIPSGQSFTTSDICDAGGTFNPLTQSNSAGGVGTAPRITTSQFRP